MKTKFIFLTLILLSLYANGQIIEEQFSRTDTLRGSMNAERDWWDVQKYDITIEPDFESKTTIGKNIINYKKVKQDHPPVMQIDLQEPLQIDSIIFNKNKKLRFTKDGNVWHVQTEPQELNTINKVEIFYL